jgi:hypothetical protein
MISYLYMVSLGKAFGGLNDHSGEAVKRGRKQDQGKYVKPLFPHSRPQLLLFSHVKGDVRLSRWLFKPQSSWTIPGRGVHPGRLYPRQLPDEHSPFP